MAMNEVDDLGDPNRQFESKLNNFTLCSGPKSSRVSGNGERERGAGCSGGRMRLGRLICTELLGGDPRVDSETKRIHGTYIFACATG